MNTLLKAVKVMIVLYCAFAFSTAKADPFDWEVEVRTFFAMIFLVSWLLWSAPPVDGGKHSCW